MCVYIMCIYIHIHIYTYTYIYTYAYLHIHTHKCTCIHNLMYVQYVVILHTCYTRYVPMATTLV